jgi:hypothetical protein
MSISEQSPFPEIAGELTRTVESASNDLRAMSDAAAGHPRAAGKWSPKQVIGHLIDSAANNHHRFVRLQLHADLSLPGYEQDGWVRTGRYQQQPWANVVALWSAYNRHLAAMIESFDPSTLGHVWHAADGDLTLECIATDYVTHLKHHLAQIGVTV